MRKEGGGGVIKPPFPPVEWIQRPVLNDELQSPPIDKIEEEKNGYILF